MKFYHSIKCLTVIALFVVLINQTQASNITEAIQVNDGYIKASIPGSNVTAAYMTINNVSGKAITLQKVSANISDRIEIHEHSMKDGMMNMRQVNELYIPAKSQVVLQPSGFHLMIFSAKESLKEKQIIPLTLHLSNKTKLNIQLPVYRYK